MRILLLLLASHAFAIDRQWILFPEESLYREQIRSAAVREGIEPDLVMAVVAQESRFKWWAISPSGARGLMQVMPETALGRPGVRGECNDLFTPGQDLRAVSPNIRCGVRYLAAQIQACAGDLVCALASYNQGPGLTARSGGRPVTAQAIEYVPKVLRYRDQYAPKVKTHFWTTGPAGAEISSLVHGAFAPEALRERKRAAPGREPSVPNLGAPNTCCTSLRSQYSRHRAFDPGSVWQQVHWLIRRCALWLQLLPRT